MSNRLTFEEHLVLAEDLRRTRWAMLMHQKVLDEVHGSSGKATKAINKILQYHEDLRCELDKHFFDLPEVRKVKDLTSPYYCGDRYFLRQWNSIKAGK